MLQVTLIGYGAIGRSILARTNGVAGAGAAGMGGGLHVSHVVVRSNRVAEVQGQLPAGVQALDAVPAGCRLALECAGHEALRTHVFQALQAGVECAVLSVGALSEAGLAEQLENAAKQGKTQVHLLAGAIGGIDAISAAKLAGLAQLTYTGRKPPGAWSSPDAAQAARQNAAIAMAEGKQATVILESSAREAARLYPKNANVAATVALAGLGLDATVVRLLADPAVTENVHEIFAQGAFGEMRLEMRGKPLADNPKTSALTVLSALRFLYNRVASMTI